MEGIAGAGANRKRMRPPFLRVFEEAKQAGEKTETERENAIEKRRKESEEFEKKVEKTGKRIRIRLQSVRTSVSFPVFMW